MKRDKLRAVGFAVLASTLFLQGCSSTGGTSETQANGARGQVVSAALSQIGTPYEYGAESPGEALDCSALTQYAFGTAGVPIPRVSTDQQKSATPVRVGKVQPGDLVFFKIRPGLYHVGLMVDGQRFVHASTSKKRVRLSSIDGGYWQQRFIGAGSYLD